MQLTPSQQKALSTERHLAVTANAGSGKTRLLVERYIHLFEKYPALTVRNVALITFTENAGAELRARIASEIKERLATLPESDTRRRLATLRDALPSAYIGTIHSFARRLLQAYPVEANVDAAFTIVQGADERLLREESIEGVFYSTLEEAFEASPAPPVLSLFRAIGRHSASDLVRTLLGNRTRSDAVKQNLLANSDEEVVASWRLELNRVFEYIASCKPLLSALAEYIKSNKSGLDLSAALGIFLNVKDSFEAAQSFVALSKLLIKNDGGFNSVRLDLEALPNSILENAQDFLVSYRKYRTLIASIPKTEEEWAQDHIRLLALLRSAFQLADDVMEEYESSKASFSLLDFDDLISRVNLLLDNPAVREELSRQFRFLMIDEFQDTDEGQFGLVKHLTEQFGARNNITIVGDPKQSIYGFRNADVAIFSSAETTIRAQTLSQIALDESLQLTLGPHEERGSLALLESFRMLPAPALAINRIFRDTMLPEDSVPYAELVLGRDATASGAVEWILPAATSKNERQSDDTDDNEEEGASEVELIARKIRQIVQHGDRYPVEEKGEICPAAYGDIAVLLRSRTNLPALEHALRSNNVPFVSSKGAAFYAQQEVLDVTNYLAFLLDPSNDLALVAILRAPFFALSDVELFQIAHRDPSESYDPMSFWKRLEHYSAKNPRQNILRAVNRLREDLALAGRLSVAQTIERIYRQSGIQATLASTPNGEQKVANLDKLLAIARTSDTSGFSILFDFVERLEYLIAEDEKESQAEFTSENAVQIMTVHAAKGLEFPIVILPFLHKQFNFSSRGTLDRELGIDIPVQEGETRPFISELIRWRERQRTIEEEKRIFYVAATRARDSLIFSATVPKTLKADSWLAWAAGAMPEILEPANNSITLIETVSRYRDGITTQEQIETEIPIARSAEDIELSETVQLKAPDAALPPLHLSPLQSMHAPARYSATQFLRFTECPTKYHLQYTLGLPEEHEQLERNGQHEKSYGPMFGSILHALLAKSDSMMEHGSLDQERFDQAYQALLIAMVGSNQAWAGTAHSHVSNFLTSALAEELRSATKSHTEFELQTTMPNGDVLYGIIDRLYKDPSGRWTILDYKTETPHEAATTRYRNQLRFYAYLVHRMDPSATTIRGILFYTQNGTQREFTFDVSDFATHEEECLRMIEAIHANEQVSDLTAIARNTLHCPDCHFFNRDRGLCVVLASASEPHRHARQVAELA